MKFSSVLFCVALLAGISQATPVEAELAAVGCTCGSNSYSATALNNALTKATSGGAATYPHAFKNYEGFSFPLCSNTQYSEYPILPNSVYNGGAPGPDRLIYDSAKVICGCVTHTGAVGNKFVRCS